MMPDQVAGPVHGHGGRRRAGDFVSRERYADVDVKDKLRLDERVRKPRATRLQQEASRRARTDISERIGRAS